MFDSKCKWLGDAVVTTGSVSSSIVPPREIFICALEKKAVHIVMVHNHPSGDPLPSEEDIRLTRRLAEIGNLMEIHLLDHVIVGDRCFFSMQEAGLLRPAAGECDVFISKKTPGTRRCT
jgi:DNA repair protein RadC